MRKTILILGIILVLLVAGCQQQADQNGAGSNNAPTQTQQTQTTQPQNEENSQVSIPPELEPPTCEDWAKTLVPKRITVQEGAGSCERVLTAFWSDGKAVELSGKNIQFVNGKNKQFEIGLGTEVGESPNKYYLKTFSGEYPVMSYKRAIYDENSVLVGYDEFDVVIDTYERVDSSMKEAEGVGCYYYEYLLGDYLIENCVKASQ